jgi:altronate dehydratase small subunit
MAGDEVVVEVAGDETKVRALDPIALGHKIALAAIRAGDAVIKYGECAGEASQDIPPGAWVHIHNLRSRRARPTDTTNVFDAQAYANAVAAALALPIPAQSLDIVAANLARLHGLAVELLAGNE